MLPVDAIAWLAVLLSLPLLSLLILLQWGFHVFARRQGLIPPDKGSWVERRWALWPAAGCLALYAACFAYGSWVEPRWIEVTRIEIEVDRPVLGYERFRIVHLSDLHLEGFGGREERVLKEVAGASPHLVLLTGDYMNAREGGAALVEVLRNLKAPHGVFGVGGLWDAKFPVARLFEAGGAVYLEDETRSIEREGHRLRLAGHGIYPGRPLRHLLEGLDDGAAVIYLQHSPDAAEELAGLGPDRRVDLFLCGHTHGGQVRLPLWGAIVPRVRNRAHVRGLHGVEGVPMYVNRGVGLEGGAVPRVRFLARPEVAVIELVCRP